MVETVQSFEKCKKFIYQTLAGETRKSLNKSYKDKEFHFQKYHWKWGLYNYLVSFSLSLEVQSPGSSSLLFTVVFIFGLAIILNVILIHLLNTRSRITKILIRVQLESWRNTVHQRLFERSRFSPIRSNSLRLQMIFNSILYEAPYYEPLDFDLNNEIYMRIK